MFTVNELVRSMERDSYLNKALRAELLAQVVNG